MPRSKVGLVKQLRSLGDFEEYLWLVEQKRPLTIVVVAELEGPTTTDQWRSALNAVQAQHPILSARVRKRPGFRPYFETAPGIELSLQILPLGSAKSLFDQCVRELETTFGANDLLLRTIVLHGEHRSTLLLAADHVAFDGRSVVYLIRDLIRSLAGQTLGKQKPLSPSHEELLGLTTSDTYSTPWAPYGALSESIKLPGAWVAAKHQLEQIWIESSAVAAITERARQEQTTVHGALTAGILLSMRGQSHRWTEAAIKCTSPIDSREILGIVDDLGLLLTVAYTTLEPAEHPSFWDLARQVRTDVEALKNIQAAASSLVPIREMLSTEMDARQVADAARQHTQALVVTNYGRVKIPSEYGPLRLLSISPMVASGAPDTQTVSLATLNGLLCMTNVSVEPIPHLLAKAKDLVISQLR